MAIDTRTPAEIAVAADIEAQLAAGGDPFGDEEEIVAETIANQADAAASDLETTAAAEPEIDEPAADAPGAADEPVVEPTAKAAPSAREAAAQDTRYEVADRAALDADRAALLAQKAEGFKKVMDGEMEPAAYAALEGEIAGKLDVLLVQRTLQEANAQTTARSERNAIADVMESSKQAGTIDYFTDVKAQKQFDMALSMIEADPDNAKRPFTALAAEAHASVLALRGIAKASGAAEPAALLTGKPPARVAAAAPMTLRGLPAASTPNTGGTAADALARLSGPEYQAAFAKLTPAQKAAMVDE